MASDNKLTIQHQPVPAWGWPDMLMDFPVSGNIDLSSVKAKDTVRFLVEKHDDGSIEIIELNNRGFVMISSIIHWSIRNRFFVILSTLILLGGGIYSVKQTPIDAIPDLSDVQVIVKTSFPGQAPQVVEDQVTYPVTTAMLSVPKAVTVRGYSFFGDSYVYVIFEEGTDLYWARSRVLEYLSQVASSLPANAQSQLGPDATGVGWIYGYALVDRTHKHDISQLRSLQDWFLKYELQTVPGVSEIATIGGMVKQYQVIVDPEKLRAYDIPLSLIKTAINRGNQEAGASVVEMGEAEYMVTATGYLKNVEDIKKIPLGLNSNGTSLQLRDVADVITGPQMRRGIAELDGEGEVVGAYVVMRFGENAQKTIELVKKKLEELKKGLPEGVEIVTTYDRSILINHAVDNLYEKLLEEFIVVVLICAVFLFHFRSSHGHHYQSAHWYPGCFHHHACPGTQCQHHVSGWHRHSHRCDGGWCDCDGGKCTQAYRENPFNR